MIEGAKLSAAVRDVRRALSMTQQQFATRLGLAMVTIARWETRRPPTEEAVLAKLRSVARATRVWGAADAFHQAITEGIAGREDKRMFEMKREERIEMLHSIIDGAVRLVAAGRPSDEAVDLSFRVHDLVIRRLAKENLEALARAQEDAIR